MNETQDGKEETSSFRVPKEIFSKSQIIKNLIVLSSGFLLLFTAYDGLAMLQSTINREQGIGVACLATMYITCCISALLLPKYIIRKIGCKNTLVLSMLACVPYISSNFYPHWIFMIPSSILVGIGGCLLWGAQCTYLNEIAILYFQASLKKNTSDFVNSFQGDVYCDASGKEILIKKYSLSPSRCSRDQINGTYVTRSLPNIFNAQELKTYDLSNKQLRISNNESYSERNYSHPTFPVSNNFKKINVDEENNDAQNINFKDETTTAISVLGFVPISSKRILNLKGSNINNDIYIQQHNTSSGTERRHAADVSNYENKFSNCSNDITQIPMKPTINTEFHNQHSIFPSSTAAAKNSELTISKSVDSTTARFFGFHGMAYFSTHIWSNLISFYVLQTDSVPDTISSNFSCICGASFCNVESKCFEYNLAEPSSQVRYTLTGICSSLALCSALLIALFLDKLETEKTQVKFSLDLLMATFKLVKKKEQILLIPLSFYTGMLQGFYAGDFTKSYIGCAWGTYHVGLVTVCYGSTCALSSTASGWLVRRLGRLPIFLTAALINVGANIILLTWIPDPRQPFMFFLVAGIWGLFTGIFWSQLRAFYGILFKGDEEAAFASFYVWYSLGHALSFAYSNYLCTSLKIYILLAISITGILGYIYVETSSFKNRIKL